MSNTTATWPSLSVRALLAVALLLVIMPTRAALHLQLEHDGLTADQQRASQQLLDESLASLPPAMLEQLDRVVPVRWSSRLPDQVMGRASPTGKLSLNRRWLTALVNNGDAPVAPERQHGTLRKELKATLIHELTHLYDRGRFWSADEHRLQRNCRARQRVQGEVGLADACRGQTDRRFTLSDAPRLLDLAGWPQRVAQRGQRETDNHQQLRSPDLYETHDPQEFVAVNLEYFLLDPQYPCRRPQLAAYWQEHFNWSPEYTAECATQLPYLNAELDADRETLAWLDPQRVYQLHYLLAEADDSWASRWGHSMLRLVICAPGRPPGPDCMLDLQHHLVLSYRAFVGDVQLSSWDGLTGVYPSRLFILPLQRVIDEYTRTELRSLSSVPLNLNREQLEGLAAQAMTQHWSYDGTYYFVSNNCAVETLKLLRTGSNHPQLQSLDSQTPYGLLQMLEARGLADDGPLQNPVEARRRGYQFDSYRARYQQMFAVLRQRLQVPQHEFSDWLALAADQRQPWLDQADAQTSAALLVLEHAALRQHLQHIQQDLKLRYLSDQRNTGLNEAGQLMQQLMSASGFLSRPADLLEQGYGLPQAGDEQHLAAAVALRKTGLLEMAEQLDEQVRALLQPEQRSELAGIEGNINQLREQLRRVHRAAGGLTL